jgi:hypothetical protein
MNNMNSLKKAKNGILIILFLLIISQNLHFSDFCEGMSEGLLFALTCLIFIVTYLIIQFRDLYLYFKNKNKFDFVPLLIFVISVLLNAFLIYANENKYWKAIKYEGKIDNIDKESWIVLFENNSFEVTKSYIEQRCTYKGKYHFENRMLILEDNNIEQKSDEIFTTRYELISDTILKPLNGKFDRIILKR